MAALALAFLFFIFGEFHLKFIMRDGQQAAMSRLNLWTSGVA